MRELNPEELIEVYKKLQSKAYQFHQEKLRKRTPGEVVHPVSELGYVLRLDNTMISITNSKTMDLLLIMDGVTYLIACKLKMPLLGKNLKNADELHDYGEYNINIESFNIVEQDESSSIYYNKVNGNIEVSVFEAKINEVEENLKRVKREKRYLKKSLANLKWLDKVNLHRSSYITKDEAPKEVESSIDKVYEKIRLVNNVIPRIKGKNSKSAFKCLMFDLLHSFCQSYADQIMEGGNGSEEASSFLSIVDKIKPYSGITEELNKSLE